MSAVGISSIRKRAHLLVKTEAEIHKPSINCPCRPFYEKEAGLVIHRRVVTGARESSVDYIHDHRQFRQTHWVPRKSHIG
jgi:hypothetical protein